MAKHEIVPYPAALATNRTSLPSHPKDRRAISIASVPDATPTQCFTPIKVANDSSKDSTDWPRTNCPFVIMRSTTAKSSALRFRAKRAGSDNASNPKRANLSNLRHRRDNFSEPNLPSKCDEFPHACRFSRMVLKSPANLMPCEGTGCGNLFI